MVKKVLRQGLRVSIKELRDLTDELVKEAKERNASIGLKDTKMLERGWIITIVNKQPECSDTWEIENSGKQKINKRTFALLEKIRKAKRKPSMKLINQVINEVREERRKNAKKIK